jgi:hypothetical protein
LCGFNNDQYNEHTVTVQTSWPANTRLHEYTGKYNTDIWTNAQGQVTFTLPKNINGMAFLVFAVWIEPAATGFNRPPLTTTQSFFGAFDLVTPPAFDGTVIVGRVWIVAGSPIHVSMTADVTNWSQLSRITYTVIGPDALPYGIGTFTDYGDAPAQSTALVTGWHELQLSSDYLPLVGSAYELKISYTGQAGNIPMTPVKVMAMDVSHEYEPKVRPRTGLTMRQDYAH